MLVDYFDLICPLVCFLFCIVHSIIEFIVAHKQNKKIDHLCEKCGLPVYDDIPHSCDLTDLQLEKLVDFVNELRGNKNG